jgi:hypothetical protein
VVRSLVKLDKVPLYSADIRLSLVLVLRRRALSLVPVLRRHPLSLVLFRRQPVLLSLEIPCGIKWLPDATITGPSMAKVSLQMSEYVRCVTSCSFASFGDARESVRSRYAGDAGFGSAGDTEAFSGL